MAPSLTLKIENETSLPDGGPLSVTVQGQRGIDIGRDQYLDWTLPDPSRYISGKHCEIRWREGGYWLHDISTNGTFLYGADSRLKAPHRLADGDRFAIGHYIIIANIDGDGAQARDAPINAAPSYDDLWNPVGEAAPPIDARQLKAPRDLQPVRPDFLDWAVDVPDPEAAKPRPAAPAPRSARPSPAPPPPGASPWDTPVEPDDTVEAMSWAKATPKPPPPEPEPVVVPTPRRPVWVTGEPDGPWAGSKNVREASQPPSVVPPVANVLAAAQALAATDAAPSAPASPDPSPERAPVAASVRPESAKPESVKPESAKPESAKPESAADTAARPPIPTGPANPVNAAAADFVRLVAHGAGLADDAFAGRNPAELAELLGQLMRLVAENTKQLLEGRQQAKRLARSANHTMIQAMNNNPLKFAPTVEDALRIMFGPKTRSYLDAERAFAQSFDDLKVHQVKTFSAMQHALALMLAEFDPAEIEQVSTADRGLAGVVGSRKARLWDIYVARWQARTRSHEDGMVHVFMDYFSECYDRD